MIRKIALKVKDSLVVVDIKDIIYFEKEKKYIKVILKNSKIIYTINSIRTLQCTLEKENLYNIFFFKPHCSYVVNLIHVKDLNSKQIIMSNNDYIPISSSKKKLFSQLIKNNLCVI